MERTNLRTQQTLNPSSAKDDWEDWEDDDEIVTTKTPGRDYDRGGESSEKTKKTTTAATRISQHRQSIQKPIRLKSRHRQKAQNAKAGIRLVTDMSKFRRPVPMPVGEQASTNLNSYNDSTAGKFVDSAALRALEGSPSSASVGSFAWLKRKASSHPTKLGRLASRGAENELSPAARPIMIGIALPSGELSQHDISPYTAVLETPAVTFAQPLGTSAEKPHKPILSPQQTRSVWSPDTEGSDSPYTSSRAISEVYYQQGILTGPESVPPVPNLPAPYKSIQRVVSSAADDEDNGTPITLFEEDGSPAISRKSFKHKRVTIVSPQSADSRSHGWWDHVTTPFMQTNNPFKQPQQAPGVAAMSPQDVWNKSDEKGTQLSQTSSAMMTGVQRQQDIQATGSSTSAALFLQGQSPGAESQTEKGRALLDESHATSEQPPPYSPPKATNMVKYCAVLPAQVSHSQRAPSPGIMTPGLPGTMTSQAALSLAEIPLTPAPMGFPGVALPNRPAGSHAVGGYFHEAHGTNLRIERQRRRFEKEDALARKVGGFWRGRGCMPENGCFGRPGREGRKRRRICLGIWGGLLAALILIVVLAVTLTRHPTGPGVQPTIWLNLTNFPPIPTGVLTVASPENPVAISGCMENGASTSWSCYVPKDQQATVSPNQPNQPNFIFQIQYDNNTRALWNSTDFGGQAETLQRRQALGSTTQARSAIQRDVLYDSGFSPNPAPPSVQEMFFLGNTTDSIVSTMKAGEPTPFYISLLSNANATIGPNMLSRRDIGNGIDSRQTANGTNSGGSQNLTDLLPPPALNSDGTGAPATLYPLPVQQPVRLFDRGLPTEHYGFYSYFSKTIYLSDINHAVSGEEQGGASVKNAKFLVTWLQTRFLVQIWTRMENSTQLLGNGTTPGAEGSTVFAQPGTMPYPVTITEDMHGGNPVSKTVFFYGVDNTQHIQRWDAKLLLADPGFGGTIINHFQSPGSNASLGGFDGGTGGCKCQWVNFQAKRSSSS